MGAGGNGELTKLLSRRAELVLCVAAFRRVERKILGRLRTEIVALVGKLLQRGCVRFHFVRPGELGFGHGVDLGRDRGHALRFDSDRKSVV